MDAAADIRDLERRLAQAEAALRDHMAVAAARRESEEKYRTMFDLIDEGFCVIEVIGGESEPVDYRFIETNASFERQTGLFHAIGRRMREMEPAHEEHWFQRYWRIARTRTPERFEDRAVALGRWYDVYAFPIGDPEQCRVGILFRDVMERKRAEQDLLKANELLRTTFDSSLQIIQLFRAVRDEQGAVVDFEWLLTNKQWNDRWGPRAGRRLLTENPAVMESGVWSKFLQVLETGVPITHEHYYPHEQFDGWFLQTIAKAQDGILLSTLDITDRKRVEIALHDSEERFRQFGQASLDGLWIRDAASFRLEYASDAMESIYGISRVAMTEDPMIWSALIVPEDRDETLRHIERVKSGASVVHEFRIQRPSDGGFRWIRSVGFPLHDDNTGVRRIAGISSDVTEEKLLIEHQGVLLAELQHRVRNIMAVIRSIVVRTARAADSLDDYVELLSGRLLTLARVQALLTRGANAGAGMAAIVQGELEATRSSHSEQFTITGPDVLLPPKAAETMTLAVHELATNALKHGALSSHGGRVEVRWEIVDRNGVSWLRFDWTESGAPLRWPPDGPRRSGFGRELIEGRVPYELGGNGSLAIEPDGARCHLEFPLKDGSSTLETDAPNGATVFGGGIDMSGRAELVCQKVLVVEDDYYLATDAARALKGAGAEIVGPCATEATARELLARARPTGVLLDINLVGGPSFALARELVKADVPFIFITGYDQEVIPDDLAAVTRLQKPVPFGEMVTALADALGTAR